MDNLINNQVFPSDSEMLNYFEANESKFHKKKQVKALQIMVETEEEIRKIQKYLLSKQKDFSTLAKEFSLSPEGVGGGDLGYFEAGLMPEEFDNVFKLKINDVSDIIRTPYGFHLFKVVDKVKERKMSFDESRNRIEKHFLEKLQDTTYQSWLIQLKKNAVIEIKNEIFEQIQ
jgi:parvulin-like peptidyl-prolyl isomerase